LKKLTIKKKLIVTSTTANSMFLCNFTIPTPHGFHNALQGNIQKVGQPAAHRDYGRIWDRSAKNWDTALKVGRVATPSRTISQLTMTMYIEWLTHVHTVLNNARRLPMTTECVNATASRPTSRGIYCKISTENGFRLVEIPAVIRMPTVDHMMLDACESLVSTQWSTVTTNSLMLLYILSI